MIGDTYAMGGIGIFSEEMESEYEDRYKNKPTTPCDDKMIRDWGGIIGPYSTC